ncbi:hypothetical protein LOY27_09860 [Pseudomonas atacamensis]|jgi:hypothetical protein|uniref:hypothetical protein n=1 Tax=Pseudomonas TaxID=286 RepID=UPI002092DEE8|nr:MULTISPECIES: hypothetical protein [Pseudomonas]UST60786.1 hypothetical protein NF672_09670 [Pseudomonas moraviensis]UST71174.1 hypothetical protein NF674_09620 [Pseudomonas moraviensis]UVL16136.1 hypothetical protein LOY27_09860 [Pseudomonas atacamensis]
MRKLRSIETVGLSVQEILSDFNERAAEFGVTEENLVSVNVTTPSRPIKMLDDGKIKEAAVQVTIIYWSDR